MFNEIRIALKSASSYQAVTFARFLHSISEMMIIVCLSYVARELKSCYIIEVMYFFGSRGLFITQCKHSTDLARGVRLSAKIMIVSIIGLACTKSNHGQYVNIILPRLANTM